MSSARDNKWRLSSPPAQQPRPNASARDRLSLSSSSTSTPQTTSSHSQAQAQKKPNDTATPAKQPPNAWSEAAAAERSRSASAAREAAAASTVTTAAKPETPPAVEETYVPVGGFNGDEVKKYMKQSYRDAIGGDTDQIAPWKAPTVGAGAKPSGPWGQKASMMTNGSDFWVQLKKQVAAREQGIGG